MDTDGIGSASYFSNNFCVQNKGLYSKQVFASVLLFCPQACRAFAEQRVEKKILTRILSLRKKDQ
jgi:hypothetical protein